MLFFGIIFAILSSGFAQNEIPSFVCEGVAADTFVRDVRNCSGWIKCRGALNPLSGYCPSPYYFLEERQVCTYQSSVQCFQCPEGFANVPVNGSCTRYVRCVGGVAAEMKCEEGLNLDSNQNCAEKTCEIPFTCPTYLSPGEFISRNDPTNCSIGEVCFGEAIPTKIVCSGGLHFNNDTLMCVPNTTSTCTVTTVPTPTEPTTIDPNAPDVEVRRALGFL